MPSKRHRDWPPLYGKDSIAAEAAWTELALRQNRVDASAVHVDHLEAPAGPHNVISRLRQFMQLRQDETGQGHVVVERRLTYPDEAHRIGEGYRGIE